MERERVRSARANSNESRFLAVRLTTAPNVRSGYYEAYVIKLSFKACSHLSDELPALPPLTGVLVVRLHMLCPSQSLSSAPRDADSPRYNDAWSALGSSLSNHSRVFSAWRGSSGALEPTIIALILRFAHSMLSMISIDDGAECSHQKMLIRHLAS